jgi:hypothetical protein
MSARTKGSRIATALAGVPLSPPVAGLTFAHPSAFASVVPGCPDMRRCLIDAVAALGLDFAFAPAGTAWGRALAETTAGAGVFWVVDGPLTPLIASDLAAGLKVTVRDPGSLVAGLDGETVRASREMRVGASLAAEVFVVAEDLAGSGGLLVDPAFAAAHVFPRLASLAAVAAKAGRPAVLHSDGDIRMLLPAIRDAGFAGVHGGGGLDRDEFEGLYWDARRAGLAVVGGISTRSLGLGTHGAVRAGTGAGLLARAGGLLIADDGGITTPEEMAAFAAALAAARGKSIPAA